MPNLTSLHITDSSRGDVTSLDIKLSLRNLAALRMTAIQKKSLEDFIKHRGDGEVGDKESMSR
jgi:hypothetical protein